MGIIKKIIENVPDYLPKKESEYGPEHKTPPKSEDIESLKKTLENAEKYFEENPEIGTKESGDPEIDEILKIKEDEN